MCGEGNEQLGMQQNRPVLALMYLAARPPPSTGFSGSSMASLANRHKGIGPSSTRRRERRRASNRRKADGVEGTRATQKQGLACRSDTHPLFFARYEKAKSQDEHRSKLEEEKKKADASRAHTSTAEEVYSTLTQRNHPPSPSLPTFAPLPSALQHSLAHNVQSAHLAQITARRACMPMPGRPCRRLPPSDAADAPWCSQPPLLTLPCSRDPKQ